VDLFGKGMIDNEEIESSGDGDGLELF